MNGNDRRTMLKNSAAISASALGVLGILGTIATIGSLTGALRQLIPQTTPTESRLCCSILAPLPFLLSD